MIHRNASSRHPGTITTNSQHGGDDNSSGRIINSSPTSPSSPSTQSSENPSSPLPPQPRQDVPRFNPSDKDKLHVNPYTPYFLMASVIAPGAHFASFYLKTLSTLSIFESRLKMKMPLSFLRFSIDWYTMRFVHIMSTFSISFFGKLIGDALYSIYGSPSMDDYLSDEAAIRNMLNQHQNQQQNQQNDSNQNEQNDVVEQESDTISILEEDDEDEEESESNINYIYIQIVNTFADHLTLAYMLRHSFFKGETRYFIWNGFLTHCIIECVYLSSTKFFGYLLQNFAQKEIYEEKQDSRRMWKVIKELIDVDTYTNYGREYIMRHFRDSALSENQSFAIFRMGLAYFNQNYYLKKYCHIFGHLKPILKTIALDLLVSLVTHPFSMIKYSQIKAAGEETFWNSSAIEHAKNINEKSGWRGFYSGFSILIADTVLHAIIPPVIWGLTDWAAFTWYKFFHPKSGLPTCNPLWQTSCECSSSGSPKIIDALKDLSKENTENIDIAQIVEAESGIALPPKGDADTCCVCMSRQKVCVLFPCRHLATCKICTAQLDKCPICRESIKSTTRIFW